MLTSATCPASLSTLQSTEQLDRLRVLKQSRPILFKIRVGSFNNYNYSYGTSFSAIYVGVYLDSLGQERHVMSQGLPWKD
jgi:hypothetical protein